MPGVAERSTIFLAKLDALQFEVHIKQTSLLKLYLPTMRKINANQFLGQASIGPIRVQ